MEEVVVIGGQHHNTLGVIRALGICNIPVMAVLLGGEAVRKLNVS